MTKQQRRSVIRILRFYKERVAYTKCTSVRIKTEAVEKTKLISVAVNTRRSDCDEFSPRQIYTQMYGHFFIGPRGKIEVKSARQGLSGEEKHVEFMLK